MDLSVIIVNYNVKEFLRGALKSVFRSLEVGGLSGEVIVVDNNSTDESVAMLRAEFPEVILFDSPTNLGFGKANNLALRHAKGDYLLLLNPDTIVGEDTLRKMVDFMRAHPETGMSGCKLLNADGSFQLSCRRGFPTPWASFTKLFGFSTFFPKSKLFSQYHLTYLPVDETYEVDALSGAFMLLSREAYERTGGFDEAYFMYGEDLDLCYRVKESGLSVYYVPVTATIHFKGESTKRSALNEVKVFYEAMHIFIKKNYGSSFLFASVLRLGIVLRSIVAMLTKHRGAVLSIVLDMLAVVAGTLLGSKVILGEWLGLPAYDYPMALVVPPLVVVSVLLMLNAYTPEQRRRVTPLLIGIPASLIVLSSLTYFFKEFASSRSLLLGVTVSYFLLTISARYALRFTDRLRFGGDRSAKPMLKKTLIVGTDSEAVRIADLLSRSNLIFRYDVVGLVDKDLSRVGQTLGEQHTIAGSIQNLPKLVRQLSIVEVIFTSESMAYSTMLHVMQAVSEQNPSRIVNFNVVPSATDVVLGRHKIELLSPRGEGDVIGLIPLQYNIHRFSHRLIKRAFDLLVAGITLPFVSLARAFGSQSAARLHPKLHQVLKGELSIVGSIGEEPSNALCRAGVTSLADITLRSTSTARPEDLEQINLYYAKHHTFGMDMEILLRSIFRRRI